MRTKWIEVVQGDTGLWHWRIKSANGQVDLCSETYANKQNCVRAARNMAERRPGLEIKLIPRTGEKS